MFNTQQVVVDARKLATKVKIGESLVTIMLWQATIKRKQAYATVQKYLKNNLVYSCMFMN